MRDVLTKRMSACAALWRVFITYERNWLLEEKPFDLAWAETFLTELNVCNAEHGVFFSQKVYDPFFEFRNRLLTILAKLRADTPVDRTDIDSLIEVSTFGVEGALSMATAMKNELGSYMKVAIEVS